MDPYLVECVKKRMPSFNRSITNGIAVENMMGSAYEGDVNNKTVAYIDRLFMINQELFPEGLVYKGAKICDPFVQFEEVTKEYRSKRKANVARDDSYMIALNFEYFGEPLFPRRILLPAVSDGGLTHINGAMYSISPVLADIGYSVLRGTIFISFRRIRLTFRSEDYHYMVDGKREISYIIWSTIHHEKKNLTKTQLDQRPDIHTSLAHYFFARDGVRETFAKWADTDIQIGFSHEFSLQQYPQEQYVRYESIMWKGRHPAGELCLLIPRDDDSDFVRLLVAGFFYVLDTFPNSFTEPQYVSDAIHWKKLLGRLIFGDYRQMGHNLEDIAEHFDSVNNYLDRMTQEDLKDRGVMVNDIWELFYKIMTDLLHHFYQHNEDEASMYNKRLVILSYVFDDLNHNISRFVFKLRDSKNDRKWTHDELNRLLSSHFTLKCAIRHLASEHGEINTVSYPGDNKFFRITSMLIPQDKARKKKGPQKGVIGDTTKLLDASIAEVGQFNNQPKNIPDGRGRLSPHVTYNSDGMILRSEALRPLIDKVDAMLKRRQLP